MKPYARLLVALGLVAGGGWAFVQFGIFNVAADRPHSRPIYWLMEEVRERSIARRSRNIEVPSLEDPAMIAAGGAEYDEMCTGCHLQPGVQDSDMRMGIYPEPPRLSSVTLDSPAEAFWIVKHGIKMSGMPAWGQSHDDNTIWSIVAFLKVLPTLTPEAYEAMVKTAHASDSAGHPSGRAHHHPGDEATRDTGEEHAH